MRSSGQNKECFFALKFVIEDEEKLPPVLSELTLQKRILVWLLQVGFTLKAQTVENDRLSSFFEARWALQIMLD